MNILEDKSEETVTVQDETEAIVKAAENAEISKTAIVFGQSEDELRREFKEFKALKLFRKIYCDLTLTPDDVFDDKLAEVVSLGFGGVPYARKAGEKQNGQRRRKSRGSRLLSVWRGGCGRKKGVC